MGSELLKGKIFRLQNDFLVFLATVSLFPKKHTLMSFVGNDYSGYWFPNEMINSVGTIWGVGLGMDSSFEHELGKQGYMVIGFEPDKTCFDAAKKEFSDIRSEIYPSGLWDKDGSFQSFGSSISLVNIFDNQESNKDLLSIRDIQAVARSLILENQKAPRVLKMNIEGAELEILKSLVQRPLNFEVIMFQAEFLLHLGFFKIIKKARACIELRAILKGLRGHGYELIHNYRNQFTMRKY